MIEQDSSCKDHKQNISSKIWLYIKNLSDYNGSLGRLGAIIFSIQSYSLVFYRIGIVEWVDEPQNWIRIVVDYISLQSLTFKSLSFFWTIVSLLILIFSCCFIAVKTNNNNLREVSGSIMWLFNLLFVSFTYFLSIPSASNFGSFLSCQTLIASNNGYDLNPEDDCYTPLALVMKVIGCIGFFAVLSIVLFRNLFVIETGYLNNNMFAKAHGRFDAARECILVTLIFLESALANEVFIQRNAIFWIMKSIQFVLTTVLAWLFLRYNPYYYSTVQTATAVVTTQLAWFSLGILFMELIPSTGYESSMFVYIGGFLITLVALLYLKNVMNDITDWGFVEIGNPYQLELMARARMNYHKQFWKTESEIKVINATDLHEDSLITEILELYDSCNQKFAQSPIFKLFFCSFLYSFGHFNFCLATLSKNQELTCSEYDISFLSFKLFKKVEKYFFSLPDYVAAKTYFLFKKLELVCQESEREFALQKAQFLNEMIKISLDYGKLHSSVVNLNRLLLDIEYSYKKRTLIYPQSETYRQYGSFLLNIAQFDELAKDCLTKSVHVVKFMKDKNRKTSKQLNDMFCEKNAVILISGSLKNLGYIQDINMGTLDMFEYSSSSELLNTPINRLMPEPYNAIHNNFLNKYLNTGFSPFFDSTKILTVKNKNGYIFQVEASIRQMIDPEGSLAFLGILSKIETTNEYIILNPAFKLLQVSRNALDLFSISFNETQYTNISQELRKIHINELIPSFLTNLSLVFSNNGYSITSGERYLLVKGEEIPERHCVLTITLQEKLKASPALNQENTGEKSDKIVSSFSPTPFIPKVEARDLFDAQDIELSEVNLGGKDSKAYRTLMGNYLTTYNKDLKSYRGSEKTFKLIFILFVVSLIVANAVMKSNFDFVTRLADHISDIGLIGFQIRRMYVNMRDVEFYHAQDCYEAYNFSICSLVTSNNFTGYSASFALQMFQETSNVLRIVIPQSTESIIQEFSNDNFKNSIWNFFSQASYEVTYLTSFTKEISKTTSFASIVNNFLSNSFSFGNLTSLASFYPIVVLDSFNSVNLNFYVPEISSADNGYYNESTPFISRYQYDVIQQRNAVKDGYDELVNIISLSYKNNIDQNIGITLVITFIPVFILLTAVYMYAIPKMNSLVIQEVALLKIIKEIPRSYLKYWIDSFLNNLNAKKEIFITSAELHMAVNRLENYTRVSSSKVQETTITKAIAYNSFNEKNSICWITLWTLFLLFIPFSFLTVVPLLQKSEYSAIQLTRGLDVINAITEIEFVSREYVLQVYSGDEFNVSEHYLEKLGALRDGLTTKRYLYIFGDDQAPGLNTDPFFSGIFFGNSCTVVTQTGILSIDQLRSGAGISLRFTCSTYMNGILTSGLNGALLYYQNIVEKLYQGVKSGNLSLSSAASSCVTLELFGNQIANVVLLSGRRIMDPLKTAANMYSDIIQPLQLIFAIFGTASVYLFVYSKKLNNIQREVTDMNNFLLLLYRSSFYMLEYRSSSKKSQPRREPLLSESEVSDSEIDVKKAEHLKPTLRKRSNQFTPDIIVTEEAELEPSSKSDLKSDKSSSISETSNQDSNSKLEKERSAFFDMEKNTVHRFPESD